NPASDGRPPATVLNPPEGASAAAVPVDTHPPRAVAVKLPKPPDQPSSAPPASNPASDGRPPATVLNPPEGASAAAVPVETPPPPAIASALPTAPNRPSSAPPASNPVSDGRSPATTATVLASSETCKRDRDRLARLRGNPSAEEVQHFENELSCEILRPQFLRLKESLGLAAAAPSAPANPSPSDAEIAALPTAPNQPSSAPLASNPASDGRSPATTATVLVSSETCKRDRDRLGRLRGNPSAEEVQHFENELSCEILRPQFLRLKESVGLAAAAPSAPANSSPSDAEIAALPTPPNQPSSAPPASNPASNGRSPATTATVLASSETCKRDRDRLARLRGNPSAEEVQHFENELSCEILRPQFLRLKESV